VSADTAAIRVMIVDENEARAALIEAAIEGAGFEVVGRVIGRVDLQAAIEHIQPDVVIIDMECPDRDILEDMSLINRHHPRPMVMSVDRSDSASIRAAVQGVIAQTFAGTDGNYGFLEALLSF